MEKTPINLGKSLKIGQKKEKINGKFLAQKKSRRKKLVRLSKLKYNEKVVQVQRVTKVVKGGKKMTFRAVVIIGDEKRKVAVGIGRAEDVNLAIEKAVLNGKKNLIQVPLTYSASIPHVSEAAYGASKIMLRPAALGTGVIAGGSVRTVLELSGIKNILAKQFGSNNILNNAKATILALTNLTQKIKLGKSQSIRKNLFYKKILKKYSQTTLKKLIFIFCEYF